MVALSNTPVLEQSNLDNNRKRRNAPRSSYLCYARSGKLVSSCLWINGVGDCRLTYDRKNTAVFLYIEQVTFTVDVSYTSRLNSSCSNFPYFRKRRRSETWMRTAKQDAKTGSSLRKAIVSVSRPQPCQSEDFFHLRSFWFGDSFIFFDSKQS